MEALQNLAWRKLEDMPFGIWEPATIVFGGKIIILGGYADYVSSSKKVQIFDPKDGSWAHLQDLPSAVGHINLIEYNGAIWFAGGMKDKPGTLVGSEKDHIIAEVWQFDLALNRYMAAPLLPEKRGGGTIARLGSHLHYIGGLKEDRDTDGEEHWIFDMDEWSQTGRATWQNAAPLPMPRNQCAGVVLNNKIYVIGGQFHHDSVQIDQACVHIYDPQSDSWREGPALPYGHSHSEAATFVFQDRIYMAAGHTTPEGGKKGFCGNLLTLVEGGEWELTAKLPKPMSSPACRIIGDQLYVIGGWDGRTDPSSIKGNKGWLSSPEVWVSDMPKF